MSAGFRSLIAGVLGRFASTPQPPITDIPDTDWYRYSMLPIEQNRNSSAINVNDWDLSVNERESQVGIQQNRPRNGVNFNE